MTCFTLTLIQEDGKQVLRESTNANSGIKEETFVVFMRLKITPES